MKRGAVAVLPDDVRMELEARLIAGGFGDYQGLAEWLEQKGFEVSRSALHRHGQRLAEQLARVRDSTRAVQLLAGEIADDEDRRSEVLVALVQAELVELMLQAQEWSADDRLPNVLKVAAQLNNVVGASTKLKEYQNKAKIRAQETAEAVAETVKKGGLSDETAELIRRQILGIVL